MDSVSINVTQKGYVNDLIMIKLKQNCPSKKNEKSEYTDYD